jgi:hypothetical protein
VPTILDRLPYSDRSTTVGLPGRSVDVKPSQIIVWVSITEIGHGELDAKALRLPVILDTGLSHNFAIREEHLAAWAGFERRYLRKLRDITIGGRVVPLHEAEVWVHSNRVGERDRFADRPPFPLQIESGIAVYPADSLGAPRLPLLGLRALQWSKLRLTIDCERRHMSLRTSQRIWFFGRS